MRSGRAFILEDWHIDPRKRLIRGRGHVMDVDRSLRRAGTFSVQMDEVLLLQSVRPVRVRSASMMVVLGLLSALSAGLAGYCLASDGGCR